MCLPSRTTRTAPTARGNAPSAASTCGNCCVTPSSPPVVVGLWAATGAATLPTSASATSGASTPSSPLSRPY